jgi:hypothetical protein
MRSKQLRNLIAKYNLHAKVISSDQLLITGTEHYIVNSDPSNMPGRHWMCIFNSNPVEFFDPLGYNPSHYGFEDKLSKYFVYNNIRLQGSSSLLCGEFCIFYLYFRRKGFVMDDIIHYLHNSFIENDSIVGAFVNKLIKT